MAEELALEKRLAALAAEVADLKRRLDQVQPNTRWLDRIIGSMAQNPAFEEAMRYGREIRQADRPGTPG
jgi:hypothetical protein